IWKKPLLWSLYLAMIFIDLGFLLIAAGLVTDVSRYLAIHAFAYGGMGLMTLGMMSRVSLGHTGRDIHAPPAAMTAAFLLLTAGAVCRVLLPLFIIDYYVIFIMLSQVLWVSAFLIFVIAYAPMLYRPRIDGRSG
ncbi:MAG: NnrS family protein, partial [Proteobacteria bacterium]|nr:NnrS family protein [Pseudomonadota bacterium]